MDLNLLVVHSAGVNPQVFSAESWKGVKRGNHHQAAQVYLSFLTQETRGMDSKWASQWAAAGPGYPKRESA